MGGLVGHLDGRFRGISGIRLRTYHGRAYHVNAEPQGDFRPPRGASSFVGAGSRFGPTRWVTVGRDGPAFGGRDSERRGRAAEGDAKRPHRTFPREAWERCLRCVCAAKRGNDAPFCARNAGAMARAVEHAKGRSGTPEYRPPAPYSQLPSPHSHHAFGPSPAMHWSSRTTLRGPPSMPVDQSWASAIDSRRSRMPRALARS